MKKRLTLLLVVMFVVSSCDQTTVAPPALPEGTVQHVVLSEDVEWRPCPQNLPSGCELAVLEGSPQTPDLFTVRFRLSDGFVMPPHTHPNDERVTMLSGQVSVAFGADGQRENATTFGPGDYYVNARDAVHIVWADELSELQVTGFGPWEADFIE
jgi:quercetin dioxygenase-like cupin family protein